MPAGFGFWAFSWSMQKQWKQYPQSHLEFFGLHGLLQHLKLSQYIYALFQNWRGLAEESVRWLEKFKFLV